MAKEPSFCVQVKSEVARQAEARPCCLKAELAACARTMGSMKIGNGGAVLLFASESSAVARRIYKLTRQSGWQANILVRLCTKPRHRNLFVVQVPLRQKGIFLLQDLGLADRKGRLKGRLEARLLDRNCCRRAYLRGCFLGSGFLNRPGHDYHLEFVFDSKESGRGSESDPGPVRAESELPAAEGELAGLSQGGRPSGGVPETDRGNPGGAGL